AAGASVRLVQHGPGNSLAVLRTARSGSGKDDAHVLVNHDPDAPQPVAWSGFDAASAVRVFDTDGPGGAPVAPFSPGPGSSAELGPGRVICLAADSGAAARVAEALSGSAARFLPEAVKRQELRMAALRLRRGLLSGRPLGLGEDPDELAAELSRDPLAAVRRFLPEGSMPPVTTCELPGDASRVVPLPHGNFLLLKAAHPFRTRLEIEIGGRTVRKSAGSFELADGTHAAFVDHPAIRATRPVPAAIRAEILAPGAPVRVEVRLQVLPAADAIRPPRRVFAGEEVRRSDFAALLANGRGAMARVRAKWGEVRSQYDAILAANPDPDVPCDRQVLFTRCRAWAVTQGFSTELAAPCISSFEAGPDSVSWRFDAPAGTGRTVPIVAALRLREGRDEAELSFRRLPAAEAGGNVPDDEEPVNLVLRPDVESRCFHEKTKAFAGPEREFPPAVAPSPTGFSFTPPGRVPLALEAQGARFVHEPEWHYMVANPEEAERGQDGSDDLFSPGWFDATLRGGSEVRLVASVPGSRHAPA
ncbi:MAG: glycogen debranching enzyme N-terminal domain-containing protein, partial [Kiritimatiellae bacterium]|nr:glycogen debranching enzyme N-terminal domain-containing protein [Kiritimatiellia bacterium]